MERYEGCIIGVGTAAVHILAAAAVNRVQPDPYMDETMHVPLAQKLCQLEFAWDDRVTTPPGLYALTTPCAFLLGGCTCAHLRLCNALHGGFLALALHHAAKASCAPAPACRLLAVAGALHPVALQCTALYYTDAGAIAFAVAADGEATKGRAKRASLLFCVAGMFRQTAVPFALMSWAVCFCQAAPRYFERASRERGVHSLDLFVRRHWQEVRRFVRGLPPSPIPSFSYAAEPLVSLLLETLPLAFAPFLLLLFAVANGGSFALGDKGAHALTFHGAMLPYFFLFAFSSLSPAFLLRSWRTWLFFRIRAQCYALLLVVSTVLVAVGTRAHPYLLADNRHFAFYAWKDVINRYGWHSRLALSPAYALSAAGVLGNVKANWFIKASFLASCAFSLVPSPLLEPRYFLLPFFMILPRLELTGADAWRCIIAYVAIAFAHFFLFAWRPFIAPDGSTARFLW